MLKLFNKIVTRIMNIKIQNCSPGNSGSKNTGSCAGLADYLEHEDEDRLKDGKDIMPFMTSDGTPVSKEDVIKNIDGNHSHLGKKDSKFFHFIISPSQDEIKAMGVTEKEQYENGIKLMKEIADSYAKNFNRDEVQSASDLMIYWKIHFTRDADDELQFHIHGIASRNSQSFWGRVFKLSPMTTHKNTEAGPVKGGFDRNAFVRKCEKVFDKLFNYERKVAETFEYQNTMKHGTPEEKAEQNKLLVKEQSKDMEMEEAIKAGINRRRMNLQNQAEVKELEEAVDVSLTEAFEMADTKIKFLELLQQEPAGDSLTLSLMAEGITCEPITGDNGAVSDIMITTRGKNILASEIMNPDEHHDMLINWCRHTGQRPDNHVKKADSQILQITPPKKKIGRSI